MVKVKFWQSTLRRQSEFFNIKKRKGNWEEFRRKIKKTVSPTVFDHGFPVGRRVNAETGT